MQQEGTEITRMKRKQTVPWRKKILNLSRVLSNPWPPRRATDTTLTASQQSEKTDHHMLNAVENTHLNYMGRHGSSFPLRIYFNGIKFI